MDYMDYLIRFTSDQASLPHWKGNTVSIRQRKIGDLFLPSGRIIAIDPVHWGADMSESSFRFSVPPGTYPAFVSLFEISGYEYVGLAYLLFSKEAVYGWEMATRKGEDIATLKDDEFFGIGVDGGRATYLSPEAAEVIRSNVHSSEHDPIEIWDSFTDDIGGQVIIEERTGLNAIYFSTGGGDGHYPSYVAFDEQDNAISLTTDFGIIDSEIDWNRA